MEIEGTNSLLFIQDYSLKFLFQIRLSPFFPPSILISKSLSALVSPSLWIVELCIHFHNVNYLERAFYLEILTNRFFLQYLVSVNVSFSSFRAFDLFIIGYLGK
jgi:hypothetical protein